MGLPIIANPKKIYDSSYLLMFKKTCRKKPKDMRPIVLPLKSLNSEPGFSLPEKADQSNPAEVLRNIRILLNKLSKANFDRICDSLLNSFSYSQEILQELSKLLFSKCVKEPSFIELYMELVDKLIGKFKPLTKTEEGLNFKKVFLNLCQSKLDNPENDLLFRAALEDDYDTVLSKKERLFGNVRLISELFNRGLAPDNFVKKCLDKLLQKAMEENIENAIHLLLGIGKKMYEFFGAEKKPKIWVKAFNKEQFDDYIDKLVALKATDKVSSRVKLLISDLVKVREEVWMQVYGKKPSEGIPKKSEPVDLSETAAKLEEQEKRKKSINEQNILGKNIDHYHKSRIEEKTRLRIHNVVEEYLESHKVDEFKEEAADIPKGNLVGHAIIHSFGKKRPQFLEMCGLIKGLYKEGFVKEKEVEEGLLVVLANFYDVLIDSPTPLESLKALLVEWSEFVEKDLKDKCIAHAEDVKKSLDEEYTKKQLHNSQFS
eukprot:TRINITY_DN47_c0_g4_i1.p9 TRINITY_DN47_c0_g4~~TRINITY_DN47_c0_g4_i1.p9  ORF type:complete len:487 (+),score=92.28 TRINITY_DN47_c0_g4_i1:25851-27311(+)